MTARRMLRAFRNNPDSLNLLLLITGYS